MIAGHDGRQIGDIMRLLFVRHGDPDYGNDCLNDIGLAEAKALSTLRTCCKLDFGTCYASPLGRAQETAAIALGRGVPGAHGTEAAANCRDVLTTLDWLQEFPARVDVNESPLLQDAYYLQARSDGSFRTRIVWDMYPAYFNEHPAYSDSEDWRTTLVALNSDLETVYDYVIESFDSLLAEHGYVRDGSHYRVERESVETLTFFCHFGITCVLLSRLWNISPFVPLQAFCMPTSSVTEIYTEERQKGLANFRATRIGDTTHLTMAGLRTERLPHSALFTEVYSDFSQRHD